MSRIHSFLNKYLQVDLNNLELLDSKKLESIRFTLEDSTILFHEYYFLNNNLDIPITKISKSKSVNLVKNIFELGNHYFYIEKMNFILGEKSIYIFLENSSNPYKIKYDEMSKSKWSSFLFQSSFRPYGHDNFISISPNSLFEPIKTLFVNYFKNKDEFEKIIFDFISKIKSLIQIIKIKEEEERVSILNINKFSIINKLDKDNNGEVDLVDGESFNKLLTKNQKNIIEIDKNYIQKFVKISMYLKTKKSNTQKIFDSIKDTKNDTELNELVNLLKNQIHTYELLVFHSISMITSLIDSDLISFYEIYECFDQLGVFNSNWENDVSGKLSNIGEGIKDLMYSIYHMEQSIVNSLDNLSYVTQDSFQDLRNSIDSQLSSIDSSIQCNNLLTGIQTYQMYKINQNTKGIN